MATTADFKTGVCIELNNDIFQILDFQHVKMQQRAPIVRTKLKSMTTGRVLEHTFVAGTKVNFARVEMRPHQFLYKDEMGYHFMNTQTFEQITLTEDFINNSKLLKEGQELQIAFHAESERPLYCELPPVVEMEVIYTEPGVKGDTATSATKPAQLETGAIIQVPLFINQGEKIKVDTRTNAYVERAK